MIHVGVNLHQRFCYMTALEARGKILQAGADEPVMFSSLDSQQRIWRS
jgi:hypothetical protein